MYINGIFHATMHCVPLLFADDTEILHNFQSFAFHMTVDNAVHGISSLDPEGTNWQMDFLADKSNII